MAIKRTNTDDLSDADRAHMGCVVGDIHRHCAQGPDGDPAGTRGRHALKNWGHDLLKEDGCA